MKIEVLPSAIETGRSISDVLIEKMANHSDNLFHLAISGGTTPDILYNLWADEYLNKIEWNRIALYWVDERCVPPSHPESNFGNAKTKFLDIISHKGALIHRIHGELPPVAEAKRYSSMVRKALNHKNGMPSFDMVILGIGTDGHTASIFPGQDALINTRHIYEVSVHPENKRIRISMTAPVILNAENIVFHVTGKDKANVINNIVNDADSALNYPAYYIVSKSGKLSMYLDEDAAHLLKSNDTPSFLENIFKQ